MGLDKSGTSGYSFPVLIGLNFLSVKAGTVQACIAQQSGTIGSKGIEAAVAAIAGKAPASKKIATSYTILTKTNIYTPAGVKAQYRDSCS